MSNTSTFPLAEAVRAAYHAGEDDETMEPLVRVDAAGRPIGRIRDGDYVIFYDIRGEREIELTQAFVAPDDDFAHFDREPMTSHWATMIEYHPDLDVRVAFPPLGTISDTLSEVVSKAGLRQVKVVESEKEVHLTYFLNGKRTEPFPGEERRIIPSLEFEGYLPPPEMRASDVADAAIAALRDPGVDLLVVNWANVDVIGHSEDREAICRAVSAVDAQLGRVLEAAKETGVAAMVTADHGTVEKWYYPDGSIDTGHTDSPVPFVLVAPHLAGASVRGGGALVDVAPTALELLGIPKPDVMTGASLIDSLAGEQAEPRRVALFILDGWGARDEAWGNLILESDTPVMDALQAAYPSTRIEAAGEAVGLPDAVPNREGKTVGNSEVGHTHLGAGRVVPSDRLRIERAIADGSFFENSAYRWAMEGAKRDGARLHLLGIISFYSSHGSVEHLKALLRMAKQVGAPEVYVHGMLGRRGEKPESGAIYVGDIEAECERLGVGQFVSLIGRFWSLDREYNWERIEKSYRWLVYGDGRPVGAR
ncbi:MAG: phosphoglycerate mutase (2,3-diphosphoglycerate-independent) [Chloroflexi bacterium]|nr:MAG: phosphoglycerate mutase (2,3-diphosphoglycerate-independent) [Chloroflexota bacterium]RLC86581.1 MAG: phosphoglycerate mutase (2,3-diphosphoglycerate-independent) [Chloroflexota bacterium]